MRLWKIREEDEGFIEELLFELDFEVFGWEFFLLR